MALAYAVSTRWELLLTLTLVLELSRKLEGVTIISKDAPNPARCTGRQPRSASRLPRGELLNRWPLMDGNRDDHKEKPKVGRGSEAFFMDDIPLQHLRRFDQEIRMTKSKNRKLELNRETLRMLDAEGLREVHGATREGAPSDRSVCICPYLSVGYCNTLNNC